MKKIIAAVLAAVLVTVCFAGCDTFGGGKDMLKVMQFNIKVGNDGFERAAALRGIIDKFKPDVIGFQEVNQTWYDALTGRVFKDGSYVGVYEGRDNGTEGTPCFYRADKYNLLDSGTFWLSDTPEKKASAFAGCNYPRIATWVKLENKKTGDVIVHVNTHLDNNGNNGASAANKIREKQAAVLMDFITKLGDVPVILTGDFNQSQLDGNGNPTPAYVTISNHMENARLTAPKTVSEDEKATMTKYYDKESESYNPKHQPIDYVFYTGKHFEALSYESFMPVFDGTTISDHLGLFCKLRIIK